MNETHLFVAAVQLIVPQPCFDKFFLDFDFFNGNFPNVLIANFLFLYNFLMSNLENFSQGEQTLIKAESFRPLVVSALGRFDPDGKE